MMTNTLKHWTYCFFVSTLILTVIVGTFFYNRTLIVGICGLLFCGSLGALWVNSLRPDHHSCWE